MVRAWRLLFFCGFLSLTLGHEGRGVFLRIKKKYLEEKLAKCLVESNLGEELTHLISARNPEPRHGAGRFFFRYLENLSPRLKVETPYLPAVEIAMRSNDSFNIHLSVQFGIYFEYKDVEIQVTKNFSAVANGSSDGFRLQSCHSCAGISHIKTWYKTVKALKEGVTPMVKKSLDQNLVPVLDANACDLLRLSLSDSDGFLLSLQDLVDLSPAGIQYSLQSFQIQDDFLILKLGLSAGEGEADGRAEDRIADLLKSLPAMQDGAVADVAMTKNQLEQNFNQLLYPFEPFIVDKDHSMGNCLLESVLPALPGHISYEELNEYLVNVTARGPPKFHGAYGDFYVIHPLKMEVFHTKEMEVAVWTLTDAYCLPADIFITDNKLKLSLTLDSGFLDMEGKNRAELYGGAYDAVVMLEKVLNKESPFPMLDYLQQELPLPLVPDIGEVMKMEDTSYDEFLLVSIITK